MMHEQDGTPMWGGPVFEDGEWWVYLILNPETEEEVVYRFSCEGAEYLGDTLSKWAADARQRGRN